MVRWKMLSRRNISVSWWADGELPPVDIANTLFVDTPAPPRIRTTMRPCGALGRGTDTPIVPFPLAPRAIFVNFMNGLGIYHGPDQRPQDRARRGDYRPVLADGRDLLWAYPCFDVIMPWSTEYQPARAFGA